MFTNLHNLHGYNLFVGDVWPDAGHGSEAWYKKPIGINSTYTCRFSDEEDSMLYMYY